MVDEVYRQVVNNGIVPCGFLAKVEGSKVVDMILCFNIGQGSSGTLGGSCFSATGRAQRGWVDQWTVDRLRCGGRRERERCLCLVTHTDVFGLSLL